LLKKLRKISVRKQTFKMERKWQLMMDLVISKPGIAYSV